MNKILILILCLCSAKNVFCFPDLSQDNTNNNESANNLMENLAEHTATLTNEVLSEFLEKIKTTSQNLANNMENVMTSTVHQLTQPFEDFKKKLESSHCQPLAEMENLNQQIETDLSKCQQNLHKIITSLQQDADVFKVAVEKNIKEIIDLPKKCQNSANGTDFSSHFSCFIDNIAGFNQQVANILSNASKTITQARHLGEETVQEGRACANEVIANTQKSFESIISSCSTVLEQQTV